MNILFVVLKKTPEEVQVRILKRVQSQIDQLRSKFELHLSTQYLSQKEVSFLYNVDVRTIYDWRKNQKLKAVNIGRRVFFHVREVAKLLTPKN